MGIPLTADEFLRRIEHSQSVEERSIGSNLMYRLDLVNGPDSDTVTIGLLNNIPNYFDISRISRKGNVIVSTRSKSIKKNLAKCVSPELNSHAFEREMKALEHRREVKHVKGIVEKINEASGVVKYHRVNIYAKYSAPDIDISAYRNTTRHGRNLETMADRVYNILPDCLSSNQMVGTSRWCAEQLGINTRDKSAYSAVRNALFTMAKQNKIRSRISIIGREENRCNPKIYWKE